MDDKRAARLMVPMQKQRRHIPGHPGEITGAIRPIDDRERRTLHAREMHEFTVPKRPTSPPPEMARGSRYQRPWVVKCQA